LFRGKSAGNSFGNWEVGIRVENSVLFITSICVGNMVVGRSVCASVVVLVVGNGVGTSVVGLVVGNLVVGNGVGTSVVGLVVGNLVVGNGVGTSVVGLAVGILVVGIDVGMLLPVRSIVLSGTSHLWP
jgi:hypothetical protein